MIRLPAEAATLLLATLLLASGWAAVRPDPVTVHLIGDSTMSEKEVRAYPETGWGMAFHQFFDETVTVRNHARNGRSTRTFLEEGRWQPVVDSLGEGDYVFVQFGHNDEVPTKASATTPEVFTANLERYVAETRAAGATPVLLTPIARRHFDAEGRLEDTHRAYSELVREVARAHDVPLVDADAKSQTLLRELGPDDSKFLYLHLAPGQHPNYPEGVEDDTHFSEYGARRMAELVLQGLRELELDLAARIATGDR